MDVRVLFSGSWHLKSVCQKPIRTDLDIQKWRLAVWESRLWHPFSGISSSKKEPWHSEMYVSSPLSENLDFFQHIMQKFGHIILEIFANSAFVSMYFLAFVLQKWRLGTVFCIPILDRLEVRIPFRFNWRGFTSQSIKTYAVVWMKGQPIVQTEWQPIFMTQNFLISNTYSLRREIKSPTHAPLFRISRIINGRNPFQSIRKNIVYKPSE